MLVTMAAVAPATSAVTTVSVMHEGVHAQATEQQKERQGSEKMSAVFGQQKVRGNRAEHEQAERIAGTPERLRLRLELRMVMHHLHLQRSNK